MDITRTWSELDLETMYRNYTVLKEFSDKGMDIKTLASANAYSFEPMTGGPMQGTCQQYLTVKTAEEGCALRSNGVTLPILVREYPKPDSVTNFVKMMHRNYLALSLDNLDDFRAVSARVIPIFGGILSIHLKVEIGEPGEKFSYLNADSSIDDLLLVKSTLGLYCEGIYTVLDKNDTEENKKAKVKALHELAKRLEEITGKSFAVKHVFCE